MWIRLLIVSIMLLNVSTIWAQTIPNPTLGDVLATPQNVSIMTYVWKILLTAITVGGSTITPFVTKYLVMGILMLIGKIKVVVPEQVLTMLSAIIAGTFAGVMGAETAMPLHGDTAALVGAMIGGGSQTMAHQVPGEIKPTPAVMKPDR
jgi:hypothetical protein